jgi:PEP-CTERM motif
MGCYRRFLSELYFGANVAGPNRFFAFAFADSDLSGFVQHQFVPEPSSVTALGAGLLAFGLLRRHSKQLAHRSAHC